MAIVTATREREKEEEEGRAGREKGQCTAQKMEVVCAPSNVRTGGTRRSEERGGRRAEGRWKASVEGELHGRVARQNETEGTRGNGVSHKKGVEEQLIRVLQPSRTRAMAKCVHAAGGQWAVKREGEDPFGGASGA
jgi:hypothetical protein